MKHSNKLIIIGTVIILLVVLLIGLVTTYIHLKNPKVNIPKYIRKEYNLETKQFNGRDVYIISSINNKSNTVILYQHGGSYATNLTETYWEFLSDMAKDTGATIVIPDYPLTPTFNYKDVFEMMLPLYKEVITRVKPENLIVMGDSAGGGLSLALCQYAGEEGIEQPNQLILISPWLDASMENEKIDQVQKVDPLLNRDLLKLAGQLYSKDTTIDNYLVSPINGPINKLKNVTIFSGTYDILNPDTELFVEKAQQNGLDIDYKETDKAVHIWILSHRDKDVYHAEEDYNSLIELINKGV